MWSLVLHPFEREITSKTKEYDETVVGDLNDCRWHIFAGVAVGGTMPLAAGAQFYRFWHTPTLSTLLAAAIQPALYRPMDALRVGFAEAVIRFGENQCAD